MKLPKNLLSPKNLAKCFRHLLFNIRTWLWLSQMSYLIAKFWTSCVKLMNNHNAKFFIKCVKSHPLCLNMLPTINENGTPKIIMHKYISRWKQMRTVAKFFNLKHARSMHKFDHTFNDLHNYQFHSHFISSLRIETHVIHSDTSQ